MPGKLFEIEPQNLVERECEACIVWFEDLPVVRLWGEMMQHIIMGAQCNCHEIVFKDIIVPMATKYKAGSPLTPNEWSKFLETLAAKGWGIYDSDTRLLLWDPETMQTRPQEDDETEEAAEDPPIKSKNIEFVVDLMEHSPCGAMSQMVVIAAIEKYVEAVVAKDIHEFVRLWNIPLISPHAWYRTCDDIKKRIDERSSNFPVQNQS